jgi:hypothetical protein
MTSRKWSSPVELRLRNAICERARGTDLDITLWDYSTTTERVCLVDMTGDGRWHLDDTGPEVDEQFLKWGNGSTHLSLYGDIRVRSYRIDLLLTGGNGTLLAIECDGHEWHERTKQQASADRARDRELLMLGVHTVRFTGSDVHNYADQCARECIDLSLALEKRANETIEAWIMGRESGAEQQREFDIAYRRNSGIFAGILSGVG